MARFKLRGKVYSTAALDELPLKALVLFDDQAAEIGMSRRWSDVETAAAEISAAKSADAEFHPSRYLVIAVTIWASRLTSGEPLTFGEAIDFPLKDIEFLPEPEDRKPGKAKGAKKAPAKRTPTSAPVVEAVEADPST